MVNINDLSFKKTTEKKISYSLQIRLDNNYKINSLQIFFRCVHKTHIFNYFFGLKN